jgi:phosphoribosylamine-glycine ligase
MSAWQITYPTDNQMGREITGGQDEHDARLRAASWSQVRGWAIVTHGPRLVAAYTAGREWHSEVDR